MIIVEKAYLLMGAARKVVTISEDRRKKSKLNTTSGRGYMEVKVKTNRRCTSRSCWHCNAGMIICWKGMAFAGHCMQCCTHHQWKSSKKTWPRKHDFGRRLYGGQGKNKSLIVYATLMMSNCLGYTAKLIPNDLHLTFQCHPKSNVMG